MVYGAQNYAHLYFNRTASKTVKTAQVAQTTASKANVKTKPAQTPAFNINNAATC